MQLCWVILVVVLLASAVGFRLGQKKRRVDQSVARRFAGAGPQVGSSAFKFDKEFIEDLASELELCPETRAVLEKNRFTRDILMNVAEKSELQTAFGIEIMDAFKIVSWARNAAKKEKAEARPAARDEKYSRSKEVFIFSPPSRRYYKYSFLGQFEFQSFLNTWRVSGIASVLDKEVETEVAGQSVTCIVAINNIEQLVNGTHYHLLDLPRKP